MAVTGVLKKAVNMGADVVKKIKSNMSVDGGFNGLAKQNFETTAKNFSNTNDILKQSVNHNSSKLEKTVAERVVKGNDAFKASQAAVAGAGEEAVKGGYAKLTMDTFQEAGRSKAGAASATGLGMGQQYYRGGTRAQNLTRMGVTAGAYAGVSVAGRKISGGSIGRNSKGERDIAGIPLI